MGHNPCVNNKGGHQISKPQFILKTHLKTLAWWRRWGLRNMLRPASHLFYQPVDTPTVACIGAQTLLSCAIEATHQSSETPCSILPDLCAVYRTNCSLFDIYWSRALYCLHVLRRSHTHRGAAGDYTCLFFYQAYQPPPYVFYGL